jgi:hypothetical protein
VLARIVLASSLVVFGSAATASELVVTDGAVVKFGQDAQLVVRDKLTAGKGVVLTSKSDDTVDGQVAPAAQTPVAGGWSGLRFERSAAPNSLSLTEMTIRYAGAQGGAGLTVLGFNPSLQYLQITDNIIGLQLLGASPTINGTSFLRNGIGIDADGNAAPVITNSQFIQNSTQAILNRTPSTVMQAVGNWWGSNTGPHDSVGNPNGLGDAVSTGVNYGGYLVNAPLIDPTLNVAGSPAFTALQNITLELNCVNAVEYRVAENGAFTGLAYQPMAATVPFTLSAGDGLKKLSVQYRASSGATATASLSPDLLYDTQGPTLSLTTPADGSYVLNPITIAATATDASGVAKVDFYINDQLVGTDTSAPYNFYWNTALYADGNYAIKVVATDNVGHTSTLTNNVTKAAPPPDTTGPSLSSVTISGTAITANSTLTRSGTLVAAVSDPSGVSKVEFLIDGVVFGTDTNGADGYSTYIDILNVTDGPHTLTIRATDSLGNQSLSDTAITVAMAAPDTPIVTAPANNTLTAVGTINITGTAAVNVQVVAYKNAVQSGTPITVDASGKFILPVTLDAGPNTLQVAAINRGGSSPLSASLSVTLDNSIPVAPQGLNAAAQPAGKIRLSWNRALDAKVTGYNLYRSTLAFNATAEAVKINSTVIPVATVLYDDLPATDGTYFYRIVAVNSLGTPSAPSNIISAVSDNTLPKATSIVYVPSGKTDPATGRIAAGRVDVTVNVSEALSSLPFLSIAPQGGMPITVDLVKQSDTVYTGYFIIAPGTTTGVAYAVFSARDMVGNRGTQIDTGLSINIDAQGPNLIGIALNPASPLKNDAAAPASIVATFTLNEAMKSGVAPQISYVLSGSPTVSQTVTGLTLTSPMVWTGNITLPASAGQNAVENLSFNYSGSDDLDNVSTTITAANSFQVYQGSLPPLAVPQNFAAVAQPGGKVHLGWTAVDQSIAYQIYRQAPGEASLTPYQRVDVAGLQNTEYVDTTALDGLYSYSVASIRSANGQESLSGQSTVAQVTADSVAPNAPQNLNLALVGAGIQATWTAPVPSNPVESAVSYNLYRSGAASITTTAGLTPILTGIKSLGAIDGSPSQAEHAYAATAVDAAGNESLLSNSSYLNFALLPVATLTAVQTDTALPQISWTHSNPLAIAGYDVYLGSAATGTKLNLTPLSITNYIDTGFAGDERPYTVVAFDSNGVQASRSLTLPKLSIDLVGGTPILRNVMNRLQYKVTNLGSQAISNASVKAKIGIHEIGSAVFGLAPGETQIITVVVGGYADITDPAQLTTTVETVPNQGERADIVRTSSVPVQDGALVLTVSPDSLTRGATGKVRFTLENTSDVDIELLTATNSGSAPSSDIRFKLLDKDGNVLAALPFKQVIGNVVTLSTGQTVARIPARSSFTSDAMDMPVPSAAPDNVTVQVEIDNIRYQLGTPEAVAVPGLSGRQQVSLVDTPYYAEVNSITPASSFGDQNIVISGRAVDRATLQALGNVALKLYLNVNGFERSFDVFSDPAGNFSYTFTPTASDGGIYKVTVVHPAILERPVQGQFVINSVAVGPTTYKLNTLRNYPYTFKLHTTAGTGTTATNVHAVYIAADQASGSLPTGVTVDTGTPLNLASAQSGDLSITVTGDNSAASSGSFTLKVYADEKGTQPVATVQVSYVFNDGQPSLYPTPSFVETGVAQGASGLEQVTLENRGYAEAQGVTATLINPDGTAAPSWIYLSAGNNIGTLAVGAKHSIDIAMTPPATLADGIYTYKLRIASANAAGGDVPIYVSLTQSGIGNVLIKASDIYTGTVNASGQLVAGLAGSHITLQNEAVSTVTSSLNTDSLGEAYFTDLPAGTYKFHATASDHQDVIGRLTVKPGITVSQDIFLDYNLVSVSWSVTPVTVTDSYTITPTVTFVTSVPAPVVVVEPMSVQLPPMKPGDVFLGELTLSNYGLVRADNLVFNPPPSDAFFRYEFLANIPTTLEAKQRITIPYRVVSLTSLDQPVSTATGGGCYSYQTSLSVGFSYTCANKNVSAGSAGAMFYSPPSSCSSSTGAGGVPGVGTPVLGGGGISGSGGGSGGFSGGGGAPAQSMPGAACVPPPCDHCSGNGSGGPK